MIGFGEAIRCLTPQTIHSWSDSLGL